MGDELAGLDATAQAELVRLGQISPLELLEATIARIERARARDQRVHHHAVRAGADRGRGRRCPTDRSGACRSR